MLFSEVLESFHTAADRVRVEVSPDWHIVGKVEYRPSLVARIVRWFVAFVR